jgi:hypothetical protein
MSSSSVCIAGVARLHGRGVDGGGLVCGLYGSAPRRTPLPALYWATDKVGGPESRLVTTRKPISC